MALFVFLPKGENFSPPYQAVVYFPGSNDIYKRSHDELQLRTVNFVLRSGRALVYPVYKGTYERSSDLRSDIQDTAIQPFYDHLGTPEADKRLVITDSNHFVGAYSANRLISESLDWLDKYLGPVE